MAGRLQAVWRELDAEQRLAGFAALALLATLFLPWYEKNVVDPKAGDFVSDSVNAFGALSFVEAAIFLVAAGVFLLLFARGERRGFHLPGGDGTVIFAAGLWAALLLLWRVFDRPDVVGRGATVGISWGFFFAFVAAAALAAAGWRIRVAARPEPPLPEAGRPAPARPAPRAPEPETAATDVVPRRRRPRSAPAAPPAIPSEDATRKLPSEDATRRLPPEDLDPTYDLDDPDPLRPGEIPRAPDR
jgi:hypothetical protein